MLGEKKILFSVYKKETFQVRHQKLCCPINIREIKLKSAPENVKKCLFSKIQIIFPFQKIELWKKYFVKNVFLVSENWKIFFFLNRRQ